MTCWLGRSTRPKLKCLDLMFRDCMEVLLRMDLFSIIDIRTTYFIALLYQVIRFGSCFHFQSEPYRTHSMPLAISIRSNGMPLGL